MNGAPGRIFRTSKGEGGGRYVVSPPLNLRPAVYEIRQLALQPLYRSEPLGHLI